MGFDSPVHWLIVIAVIALLFGGSRVGNLMGELGKGIKSFKQNMNDADAAKPATAEKAGTAAPEQIPAPGASPDDARVADTANNARH
ncbi:MAG TPA: twin-arginine translocase TatA/TatE family subunit [Acidiphilium sp.]|jgi:sec-independent protein translocase protein TatA|uniref:twin-arginine translocase TatA/TatE family subunit n=1 Tax=unclassified Acidiphilium TaxID=2617493 RepID=UPI000BC8D2E3|nr:MULTISPECIES: twin-arginine translocase TatA/TatE family subunit [unclassified Acidiphilium]OYV56284.1 MAG: Sec-independent protein translocase TatA [Acidiphilium sp. 20-67-58]OYV86951.1 MAG: Sec-independent protein translocase TatA [Acidiphilium sp. 21-68-69]HQT61077.1 twin-arginine translocase TatA/TatE family subunit [Acidiphilium sp.]HQU10243.1 twin-arginine translocase TatA/TatE family subunit [Acidiphilium sp.]